MFGTYEGAWQADVVDQVSAWAGVTTLELPPDYVLSYWSDFLNDNAAPIVEGLRSLVASTALLPPTDLAETEGEAHGIRYRIRGSGPPLLLFPVALTPTQWDEIVTELSREFTTVRLSGAYLGFAESIEERARSGYLTEVGAMFDLLEIKRGERVLEVGAGSGALVRELAKRTRGENPIVGFEPMDIDHSGPL